MDLKKGMLWMGIGSIGMTALVTAIAFLFGDFGHFFGRLIATTLTFGGYGFMLFLTFHRTGGGDQTGQAVVLGGVIAAAVGLVSGLGMIWDIFRVDTNTGIKVASTAALWSLCFAWFVQVRVRDLGAGIAHWLTISIQLLLLVSSALMTVLIWGKDESELVVRLFGMTGVLTVGCTLVLPLLRKIALESPHPTRL